MSDVDVFIKTAIETRRLSKMLAELASVEGIRVTALDGAVELQIHVPTSYATAALTISQVDALIRALAAARVELSKARPSCP